MQFESAEKLRQRLLVQIQPQAYILQDREVVNSLGS